MNYLESIKKTITFIIIVVFPVIVISLALTKPEIENEQLEELRKQFSKPKISSVDHSQFKELQVKFDSPHQITAACLSCHTGRGKEVIANAHWNWEREEYIEGKGITYLGKKNLLNNFCTGILSNERACNRCHIGFGWKDKGFDFSNELNIDCIVCHDKTGTYQKATGGGGYPVMDPELVDINHIVQNVGTPSKHNCGYCHFSSAGGNNVKHGDLEVALLHCDKNVDVHMAKDGYDMSCADCHVTENHQMRGMYYAVSSSPRNRASCTDCHGAYPHNKSKLNEHTIKVDCRTCHIPTYAKVNPTKMFWDWSTAGQREGGLPYVVTDSLGNEIYLSEKGSFHWETNAIPEYVWFNGYANHHIPTEKITSDTVNINTLYGSFEDPKSKIIPVKVHRGKQPYDTQYMTLLQAKLWAENEGEGAMWVDLDWDEALKRGMEYVGLPFSGNYDFIDTRMYLPVSHMVSKAENALSCTDCHHRTNSRIKNVEGVYVPAMSANAKLNLLGKIFVVFSILGVAGHGMLRYVSYRKRAINLKD